MRTDDGRQVVAYETRTGEVLWRKKTRASFLASARGILVYRSADRSGVGDARVRAVRDRTGKQLWSVDGIDKVCGVTSSEMLVQANDQLVRLDLKIGRQLGYSPEQSECPEMLSNGLSVAHSDDGDPTEVDEVTLTKRLEP